MNQWNFYTTNQIKPCGWLKRQLEIQAEGLSGNLDKMWPDVKDSAWIGGDREGWERVPYWLDGFIPLAYLLEDEDMINRAKKYIDAIIDAQCADGWICPCNEDQRATYDTWAVQLITKVLLVYYECSKDQRVPEVIYKTLKNYYELLKDQKIKLFQWGAYRWFEAFIALNFVYEKYKEDWMLELAKILKEQGVDYNKLLDTWKRPINKWQLSTHIVNITMMLKYEAVSCKLLGEDYKNKAEELREFLDKYNGTVYESFTGDECLSGISAIQGTELCAIVEQMYSYELLYAYTGDEKWAERLEVLAFNALPATISDDMWAHQYLQMSNQIACEKFPGKSLFRTNDSQAHIFGLEPNYGCCTANFNQGWPKFALSAFMHKGDTVLSAFMIPCELNDGKKHIKLETNYPFENSARYIVTSQEDFKLELRIPKFAQNLRINGESFGVDDIMFEIKKGQEKEIVIEFDAQPYFAKRPNELFAVKCGSLIFSVPISFEKRISEYEKNGVERKFPYCDYEYIPTGEWNYAYSGNNLCVEKRKIDSIPFSSNKPAVVVKAKVKQIDWGLEDGYEKACAKVPQSLEPISDAQEIELYPYGCAKLRMTEIPIVE